MSVPSSTMSADSFTSHLQMLSRVSPQPSDRRKLPKQIIDNALMVFEDLERATNPRAAAAHWLCDSWPNIWRWAQVLLVQFVDEKHYGPPQRAYFPVIKTIANMCSLPGSRDVVRGTPGIITCLTSYWLRHDEIIAPLLRLFRGNNAVVAIAPPYPWYTLLNINDDTGQRESDEPYNEMLAAAGGRHDIIARTAIAHLKYLITCRPFPLPLVNQQVPLSTNTLSYRAPPEFHYAFLREGGLEVLIQTLEGLNAESPSEDVLFGSIRCFQGFWFGFLARNGPTWAVRALDAGFLPAMIRSLAKVAIIQPNEVKLCRNILTDVLAPFLVYRDVVRATAKAMAQPDVTASVEELNGTTREIWATFFEYAYDRVLAKVHYEADLAAEGVKLCGNSACTQEVDITALKSCTGCGSCQYCSKACQKEDWKNHKPLCTRHRKAVVSGELVQISARDRIFAQQCILQDVLSLEPVLVAQWESTFPNTPRKAIAVMARMTQIPTHVTLGLIDDVEDPVWRESLRKSMRDAEAKGQDSWIVHTFVGTGHHTIDFFVSIPAQHGREQEDSELPNSKLLRGLEEIRKVTFG